MNRTDHFTGAILGQAVGDALGAPFEGVPPEAIYYQFGLGRKIVAAPPVDRLVYTDDTQMMISVAEMLIEAGCIDEDRLAALFAGRYQPHRGYGMGARQILEAARGGADYRALAANIFPGGSLGNGAAMRAAPVGLFFHTDLDRVWVEAGLSARPTHVHPVGIEGAQLVALATALALRGTGRPFDSAGFWAELQARAVTGEFREALAYAANLGPQDPVSPLGHSLEAHRSVVTAIACFVQSPDSYEAVIGQSVALGGDCDTIAAMAGAISGARLGISAVPPHLLELLEDGAEGRSFLFQLARDLSARASGSFPMQDGPSR